MEYLLMLFRDEAQQAQMTPSQGTEMTAAFGAYTEALQKAGVWRAGARLRPTDSATTLRAKTWQRKASGSAASSFRCCRTSPRRSACSR